MIAAPAIRPSPPRPRNKYGAWFALVLWGVVAWIPALRAEAPPPSDPYALDRFDTLAPWSAAGSDGVKASITPAEGVSGGALRLDFDLAGTAGYALAARAMPLDLPPNFELTFWMRADAPTNDLQVKLVDASGDNVWWFHRRNVEFARDWHLVRIKKRQVEFAWGPAQERELRHVARIEFVVAAGRGGGAGSIYFSGLALRPIPPDPARWPPPRVQASSYLAGSEPALAADGSAATAWRSDPNAASEQTLTMDFGQPRELGALMVQWLGHAYASRYDLQFSDDGEVWRTVRSVGEGRGGPDALMLPDAETRFLRLALHAGPEAGYGIAEIDVEGPAAGASPNVFFETLARKSPRGQYPRGLSGEQAYWTIVGIDGGADSGLLSEDGAVEVAGGGFSIEPFVVDNSRVVTWADVGATQSLVGGYLPMPSVEWPYADWRLRVSAFAAGTRGRSRLFARYELRNVSHHPITVRLVLAVRPFQVNPPAQALNLEGGVSAIRDIAWDGTALVVNGGRGVRPLQPPDHVAMAPFEAGPAPQWGEAESRPGVQAVHDAFGYASATIGYDLALKPYAETVVDLVVPLNGASATAMPEPDIAPLSVGREQDATAAAWRGSLDRVRFDVPAAAQPLIDALRTSLAHLLILRDGPILRPGTRSYARSWIRDGAMISESLLRLGHADAAIDYARWFAPHQFANGKVPCCVDARGADPVAENDSGGEFVFLIDEIDRYTHDRTFLAAMWPHVVAAMRYMETLRRSGSATAAGVTLQPYFHGLLPASISHEGYSAQPMHSYWDDFWAVKGYRAAVDLAQAARAAAELRTWQVAGEELQRDVRVSLRESMGAHGIAYLPGAAELGDFDPTSTAIAFAPGAAVLDPASEPARATFERYWREFVDRREGRVPWEAYTPYELRTVGTFVRLGWCARAHELLAFFLADRRPRAWNQWAEVVGRNEREPRFIGDMPHGWVASDYIRSVLDLFAYERDADRTLVLGRGIPRSWLEGRGIAIHNLHTPYGLLSYALRKDHRGRTILHVDGTSGLPPGGYIFIGPAGKPPTATMNGKPLRWHGGELRVTELPATVVVNAR